MTTKQQLKEELKLLIQDKEDLEKEIEELTNKIKEYDHLELDEVTDEDGFPRKGLDYLTLKQHKDFKVKRIGFIKRKTK